MVLLKGFSWAEMLVEEMVGKKVVMMVLCLAGTMDPVVVEMLEHATVENLVASSADSWALIMVAESVEQCFDVMVSRQGDNWVVEKADTWAALQEIETAATVVDGKVSTSVEKAVVWQVVLMDAFAVVQMAEMQDSCCAAWLVVEMGFDLAALLDIELVVEKDTAEDALQAVQLAVELVAYLVSLVVDDLVDLKESQLVISVAAKQETYSVGLVVEQKVVAMADSMESLTVAMLVKQLEF